MISMPRIARNSFETSFFHVMTQGVNREYIFRKSENYPYSSSNDYKNNTATQRNPILVNVLGSDFSSLLYEEEPESIFKDICIDKRTRLEEGIAKFEKIKNIELKNVLEDKCLTKELIKYLKEEYKIREVEMIERFGITKWKMNRLKK